MLCGTQSCIDDHSAKFQYHKLSIEGYMPAQYRIPAGAATLPLWIYWCKERRDNWVTTDDAAPLKAGYKRVSRDGLQGTVLANQAHGTVPLWVYYSAAADDHVTCTLPDTIRWLEDQNYTKLGVEPIGWVFDTPEWWE